MTIREITIFLAGILGENDSVWDLNSGHDKSGSFMIVRFNDIRKGHLKRLHSMIEDLLSEDLGDGDRV